MTLVRHRVLFIFVAVLFLFLVVAAFLVAYQQRDLLRLSVHQRAVAELALMADASVEALNKSDYETVKMLAEDWGASHKDIRSLQVVAPNGYVLADHQDASPAVGGTYALSKEIKVSGTTVATIKLLADYREAEMISTTLRSRMIVVALIVTALLGTALWLVFRKMALAPLEVMVEERTRALSISNQELEQEIAERVKVEEALREGKEQIALILNSVAEGVYGLDLRGTCTFCNPAALRFLGYARAEDLIGKNIHQLIHHTGHDGKPLPLEDCRVHSSLLVGQGTHADDEVFWRSDGQSFPVEYWSQPILRGGVAVGAVTAFVDITDRKRAEEKIRRSEEFVRNILDTVDEGFIVLDRDLRILSANKAYYAQAGGCEEEILGKHCYEVSHKTNRPCFEEGEDCAPRRVFETGTPHTALHRHEDVRGNMLYIETKSFPIKDESGAVTAVIETLNNITERYLLEEERLKTQKLESIGTLAGGIAHDFNNLLQGVFGYISLAKLTSKNPERSVAALEQAEMALHQSVNLTTQLLTFAKGGKPAKKIVDLRLIIENAAKFSLSGSRADLRLGLPEDLWQVEADEGQLSQVFQNIVLNADQSMPTGGTITVTAANMAMGAASLPSGLAQGNYVTIAIQDAGVGISEQDLAKIFDPYFTTKEKGTGLGLATSYSIVRNHGGLIDVRTKSGVGSTFLVYLPANVGQVPAKAAEEQPMPSHSGVAKVLVMDDEDIIRDLSVELLGELGHEVVAVKDGQEALDQYRGAIAAGRPFDIVILDLTIRGGMGGRETVRELQKIDPHVKAVVASGYSDDAAMADYQSQGFKAFLKKPYNLDVLNEVMHTMLHG